MVNIVEPSVEIVTEIDGKKILKTIEKAARTCYKTEGNISQDISSAVKMINKLIEMGHTAMLEFADIHILLRCDVGVYKDLTRQRHCSFAIESTRYCNYSKDKFGNEITFIKPINIKDNTDEYAIWYNTMYEIEQSYNQMANLGCTPDQLRMLLPHSTAAFVNMKANIREWRHIFSLRCAKAAHPSVRQVMLMTLNAFHRQIPVLFDDLFEQYKEDMKEFGITPLETFTIDTEISFPVFKYQGIRSTLDDIKDIEEGYYFIKDKNALYLWAEKEKERWIKL